MPTITTDAEVANPSFLITIKHAALRWNDSVTVPERLNAWLQGSRWRHFASTAPFAQLYNIVCPEVASSIRTGWIYRQFALRRPLAPAGFPSWFDTGVQESIFGCKEPITQMGTTFSAIRHSIVQYMPLHIVLRGAAGMLQTRILPKLSGVQETMLWTLYERASAAKRPDGILRDDECVRIFDQVDYDFAASFGQPSGHAPARAAKIDTIVRRWLSAHPDGLVISLGEGLETQAYRVDNGTMRWLSVDLPDAIDFRERFLPPTERFRHLAMSASDPAWMDHVDDRSAVFIIAQGLLMYFSPETARRIFVAIAERFAGAEMVFDMVPHSLIEATAQGHRITETWTSPLMPWGLDRNEVKPTLRSWLPGLKRISVSRYRMPTARPAIVEDVLDAVLPRRQKLPSLVHIRL